MESPSSNESPSPLVNARTFWILLAVGVLIRLTAIHQPLIDAHLVRQAQTADWTFNAFQEQTWPLSAEVSWRGDTPARLTLEFPIYNYLARGVWLVIGNLDMAGKIVSILLWALSFIVLQKIWSKLLNPRQAFWANVLFLLSPLSVFFGQAFMPEMLIQLLGFLFLHQLLRYWETGQRGHYFLFALTGLAGLLVKSLEISHLYAVALVVFWRKDGWKLLARPEHWIGGAVTLACYLVWTRYVDQVNQPFFPAWTASTLSHDFLGDWRQRLDWHFYFKVTAYLAAFVAGPVGLIVAVLGCFQRTKENRLGFWWAGSLVFFYLVWGMKTAGLHSYYNLPALGPICFLFGTSMPGILDRLRGGRFRWCAGFLVGLIILPLLGCSLYLFRQDHTILDAALWIKGQSRENDLVFLRVNHRRDNNGYPEYPVFSYYAKRKTWIDTDKMKEADRAHAVEVSTWAVITRPPSQSTWAEKIRDKIARYVPLVEIPDWPKPGSGFVPVHTDDRFVIYRKKAS
jgi:hypothetical protein